MKKAATLFSMILIAIQFVSAQGTWTQQTSMAGNATHEMASFTINGKGYIVGGTVTYPTWTNQVWEYDTTGAGSWTQKTSVPSTGGLREPVAFVIGGKGYVGTGVAASGSVKNFYEFNPVANTWTAKANFGGTARRDAIGFSIGNKGYIGTGSDATASQKDFWEYDTTANAWTARLSLGGVVRNAACGFSIGTKGYITTGRNGASTYNDLWEYDPSGNTWTQMANFTGVTRSESVVFVIGSKAYVGLGHTGGATDFKVYDQGSNTWGAVTNFPGSAERFESVAFSVGNKGYVCGGVVLGTGVQNDVWEYAPAIASGVNETNSSIKFSIYPNPASDVITVSCDAEKNRVIAVKLVDLQGKIIMESDNSQNSAGKLSLTFDVSKIAKGAYLVHIITRQGTQTQRVVVAR